MESKTNKTKIDKQADKNLNLQKKGSDLWSLEAGWKGLGNWIKVVKMYEFLIIRYIITKNLMYT